MSLKNWIFLLCVAVAMPLQAQEDNAQRQIVVLGSGEMSAPPDQAVITLGARHTSKTAADALAQTSRAVAAILSRMQEMGIDSMDVQTSSLSLNPVWGKSSRYEDGEVVPPIGFEAANSVRVTLRDLGKLGDVLDQVAQEGANAFSGFRFGLSDPEPILDQARSRAVADARRKAELYAQAAGVTVGAVVLITEESAGSGGYPPPVMEMASARSAPVPIAQGEITQRSTVKVIYTIAD